MGNLFDQFSHFRLILHPVSEIAQKTRDIRRFASVRKMVVHPEAVFPEVHKNGIFLIPDILANAGGVCVSYFEWVQNKYGYYWKEEEVNAKLEEKMIKEFGTTFDLHKEKNIDMRTAAYVLALGRIDEATKDKALY